MLIKPALTQLQISQGSSPLCAFFWLELVWLWWVTLILESQVDWKIKKKEKRQTFRANKSINKKNSILSFSNTNYKYRKTFIYKSKTFSLNIPSRTKIWSCHTHFRRHCLFLPPHYRPGRCLTSCSCCFASFCLQTFTNQETSVTESFLHKTPSSSGSEQSFKIIITLQRLPAARERAGREPWSGRGLLTFSLLKLRLLWVTRE